MNNKLIIELKEKLMQNNTPTKKMTLYGNKDFIKKAKEMYGKRFNYVVEKKLR